MFSMYEEAQSKGFCFRTNRLGFKSPFVRMNIFLGASWWFGLGVFWSHTEVSLEVVGDLKSLGSLFSIRLFLFGRVGG